MFKRSLGFKVKKAIARSPVVLLTGARQSGKTTLIKEIGQEQGYSYVSFDDMRHLSAAKNDPIGFLAGLSKPIILDEVQRMPELFLAIKQDVDENRIAGRYLLTGSANPLLIPKLGDSLAGRMEILELFPLSAGEIEDRQENCIEWLFSNEVPKAVIPITKDALYQKILTGGYPSVQGLNSEDRDAWFASYITTILHRDVQDLAQIAGLTELPRLLQLLATRVGNLLNVADISRTSGIATTTLHRYLALLQTVFLVNLQQPWSSNLGKRLIKAPKMYLVDTGLLSFLLDVSAARAELNPQLMGAIVENFVHAELLKQATWNTVRLHQYHMRTQTGIEIDIVLENTAGKLVGIEIKNSQTVSASDFKGLSYLQQEAKTAFHRGIVLYTGSEIVPFGPQLYALPMCALWQY